MNRVWFRFYEELNDFLPTRRKKQEFMHEFEGSPAVKDLIESLGVPHPEVDLIIVNGESSGFSRKIKDGDHISVYPVFESIDISGMQRLRKEPLRVTMFILDVHLGKLARYLRLLGFDSVIGTDTDDKAIIEKAVSDKRIILTRDKMLLRNSLVTHGYWIRSSDPTKQAREVVHRFDLLNSLRPFTRCMECNSLVKSVAKEEIVELIPLKTKMYYDVFRICNGCRRIYWEGSHYDKMKEFVENIYL